MFGMVFNPKADKFRYELNKVFEKCSTAKKTNKKVCQKCGFCCWTRPCNLVKDDVKKIADFLHISELELFSKYLVVDQIKGKLVVLPRRKSQEDIAGKYVPDDRTYDIDTPCVFLNEKNLCQIHAVKPFGGRNHECWKDTIIPDYSWKKEDVEVLGWNGEYD